MRRARIQAIEPTVRRWNAAVPLLEQKEEDKSADEACRSHDGNVLPDDRRHKSPLVDLRFAAEKHCNLAVSKNQHGPDDH